MFKKDNQKFTLKEFLIFWFLIPIICFIGFDFNFWFGSFECIIFAIIYHIYLDNENEKLEIKKNDYWKYNQRLGAFIRTKKPIELDK